MSCKDVLARLSAYQDGEVSPELQGEISSHLAGCSSCSEEWRSLERLHHRLKIQEQVEPSPAMAVRIMAQLRTAPPSRRRLLPSIVYAAAFLVFFTLGFLTTLKLNPPASESEPALQEQTMASVLLASQDMNLLGVQAQSLDLLGENGHE